jgi:hypothetical protein
MIGTTNSGILYQLRDIYSRCCWNVATYKCKVHARVYSIYSIELEIKDTTDTDTSVLHPDQHLEIESEGWLTTKLYDKGLDFKFPL